MPSPHHHTIITGTGRTGTTFLVVLLTKLQLNTGYKAATVESMVNQKSHCGLEGFELGRPIDPYFVKHPLLCEILDRELTRWPHVKIDYAIVPMRNLHAAAESRRQVQKNTTERQGTVWLTNDASKQEEALAITFYKLMRTLAKWQIPPILLDYPRLTQDPAYLYERLLPIMATCNVSQLQFTKAFEASVKPELVHKYGEADV